MCILLIRKYPLSAWANYYDLPAQDPSPVLARETLEINIE